jgi:hypothetical protein|tara:strand:+ start:6621 stop:7109 length:489 start_codon:yes stop_codon:yes gene_type:complete
MIEILVQSLEGSTLNIWILSTAWFWPSLEIFHFIGLSLLLGSMLIIDVRLAGFVKQMNIMATHRLLPLAGVGFLINLTTGVLFFIGDPARYAVNIGFQIKMLLIIIAGLNALWFAVKISPMLIDWDPYADTSSAAKISAYVSLSAWFGVLLLGRLIPYVGTG